MLKTAKRLYKYRAFSALTIDCLLSDMVFFADPSTFNDPLDTKPVVTADVLLADLKQIVRTLIERRLSAEMTAAAKTIRYRGPRTIQHIGQLGHKEVERMLAELAYKATDPEQGDDLDGNHQWLLEQQLQLELMKQYDRGILSLAERNSCPLMWSHYGDQHHGLCIGYRVPDSGVASLHRVHYGGSRLVEASKVARMLDGDPLARKDVDEAVLLRKAGDWRYEKEWRLIGQRGLADCPLELEDVTFGLRCKDTVKAAVVKALDERSRPVGFFEIREVHGTFRLKRARVDTVELSVSYPRRAAAATEGFDDVDRP